MKANPYLLGLAILLGPVSATTAVAQQAVTPPPGSAPRPSLSDAIGDMPAPLPSPDTAQGWEPDFLRTLPQPPEQPLSLLQQPPPPGPPPPNFEHYFENDPLLDPPQWGKTGWFTDVQIGIVRPTIFFGQMRHRVNIPGGHVQVAPGAAKQGFTAAPRIEIGYRLPSGFGGFSFSDRFFNTSGSGPFSGPAGTLTRSTSIGVNYSDWDYFTPEWMPWANWRMQWRAGVRLAETWIDNRAYQSVARASSGTGVIDAATSNYTVGAGPHFGLQLSRGFLNAPGLSFVGRIDIADTFTRERQLYSATVLTPGGNVTGNYTTNFWQEVPILNYQVGLGYTPPSNPNISLYAGYVYEFWWQIASNSNLTPAAGGARGSFDNQGIILQAQIKF